MTTAGITAVRIIDGAHGPLRIMPGACVCWTGDRAVLHSEHCCLRGLPALDDDAAWDRIITGDDPHCGHVLPLDTRHEGDQT